MWAVSLIFLPLGGDPVPGAPPDLPWPSIPVFLNSVVRDPESIFLLPLSSLPALVDCLGVTQHRQEEHHSIKRYTCNIFTYMGSSHCHVDSPVRAPAWGLRFPRVTLFHFRRSLPQVSFCFPQPMAASDSLIRFSSPSSIKFSTPVLFQINTVVDK